MHTAADGRPKDKEIVVKIYLCYAFCWRKTVGSWRVKICIKNSKNLFENASFSGAEICERKIYEYLKTVVVHSACLRIVEITNNYIWIIGYLAYNKH